MKVSLMVGCILSAAVGLAVFTVNKNSTKESSTPSESGQAVNDARSSKSLNRGEKESEWDSYRSQKMAKVKAMRGELISSEENLGYDNSYEVLMVSHSGDPDSREAFIEALARHPEEEKLMREQNKYVKRRKLVRQTSSLRDIAAKIGKGEPIPVISVPGFDGENIQINVIKRNLLSSDAGSFVGRVGGDPTTLASIAFQDGSDAGEIHVPSTGQLIEIQPYDDSLVIIKDIDHDAFYANAPCSHCSKHD